MTDDSAMGMAYKLPTGEIKRCYWTKFAPSNLELISYM